MDRKPTPVDIETAVLLKSARRCTLCFHLNGDLDEQIGQIAHLDKDPSNSAEDNLAFMCLEHHTLFDSKTSQHKNYTIQEVKAARSRLHEAIAKGKYIAATAEARIADPADSMQFAREYRARIRGSYSRWRPIPVCGI